MLLIKQSDIIEGATFKCVNGITWFIDSIEIINGLTLVSTSMEGGKKGNYKDDVQTVIEFLNEEKAVKRKLD